NPHTPSPFAKKQGSAVPFGAGFGDCATPPLTCVPGATISGFKRPSAHGPRLEKKIMSFALFAPLSPTQPSLAAAWTFSAAPTVSTFFAVPGAPSVPGAGPALPAAKTITIS